jgi:hypothetical protein
VPRRLAFAYLLDKVVAVLVAQQGAPVDAIVQRNAAVLAREPGVALFRVDASQVADFSKITQGVDLSRTPALIVLRQRSLSEQPEAAVRYGLLASSDMRQMAADARYDGPVLPFYPVGDQP